MRSPLPEGKEVAKTTFDGPIATPIPLSPCIAERDEADKIKSEEDMQGESILRFGFITLL